MHLLIRVLPRGGFERGSAVIKNCFNSLFLKKNNIEKHQSVNQVVEFTEKVLNFQ